MGVRQAVATAPTAAERARSMLAAAWSCAVTTENCREELVGAHAVTEDGGVRLCVPDDSVLAAAAVCAPRGEPTALLEFCDAAPVPVRDRIRSRLWLSGRFVADTGAGADAGAVAGADEGCGVGAGGGHLLFKVSCVVLHAPSGHIGVDPDEFTRAAPDPLALAEAHLLTHLADAHGDAVEWLTRLVDAESLHGVVRAQPLALDRYGLTLRLERARGHGDVRLPFHRPADSLAEVTERMHVLIASARALRRPVLRPLPED
ncbi:DUF2470 domain-containing protein [Streptomyces sp. NPDC091292]|uniref:DUF2470 domain-containing protein n=1 Tax=Streptomyces sp. NPDC091292 TaxID=3365991 RepID=UPI00380BC636